MTVGLVTPCYTRLGSRSADVRCRRCRLAGCSMMRSLSASMLYPGRVGRLLTGEGVWLRAVEFQATGLPMAGPSLLMNMSCNVISWCHPHHITSYPCHATSHPCHATFHPRHATSHHIHVMPYPAPQSNARARVVAPRWVGIGQAA